MAFSKGTKRYIVYSIFAIALFGLFFFGVYYCFVKCATNTGAESFYVAVLKDKPDITFENIVKDSGTDDKINVYIKCNANYKNVKVCITLYNKSNEVVETTELIGENYLKGETYTLVYQVLLVDSVYTTNYGVRLISYS